MKLLSCLFLCVFLTLCLGCQRGPAWIEISGTIGVDGTPIERGVIQLEPVDGGLVGGGKIANGSFTAKAIAGRNIVRASGEVTASEPVPDPVRIGEFVTHIPITDQTQHWTESQTELVVAKSQKEYNIVLPAVKK